MHPAGAATARSHWPPAEPHPGTGRRDPPPQGPQDPADHRAQSARDSSPSAARPRSEAARIRQAAQDKSLDHYRRNRRPAGRPATRFGLQRLRRLRGSGPHHPPPGHPLPPRTLADPRRPKPGSRTARRRPARQSLWTEPDLFHHPPVSPPARHPAVALGAVGPTGHGQLSMDPNRYEVSEPELLR